MKHMVCNITPPSLCAAEPVPGLPHPPQGLYGQREAWPWGTLWESLGQLQAWRAHV